LTDVFGNVVRVVLDSIEFAQISFLIKELNAPTTVELRIDNEPIATLAVDKSKERYAFEHIELREGRRTLRVIPHGVDSRYLHAFISRQN